MGRTIGPKGAQASGSGRIGGRTAEGRKADESQERRNSDFFGSREEFRQRRERSEGEEKITRVNTAETETTRQRSPPGRRQRTTREFPEDPAGNGQGRGGSGQRESNRYHDARRV
jgi:hypothetical protein